MCVDAPFLLPPGGDHSPIPPVPRPPSSLCRSDDYMLLLLLCCAHHISLHLSTYFLSGSEGPCSVFFIAVVSHLSLLLCVGVWVDRAHRFLRPQLPTDPQSVSFVLACRVRTSSSTVSNTKKGAAALRGRTVGDRSRGYRSSEGAGAHTLGLHFLKFHFINFCLFLFLAVLGLRCGAGASLVAEHRL